MPCLRVMNALGEFLGSLLLHLFDSLAVQEQRGLVLLVPDF